MSEALSPDIQGEVAALLAVVATSDGSIATQETERLVTTLRRSFGLTAGTALELAVRAIDNVPPDRDMSSLLRRLDAMLGKKQKECLVAAVLELIAADGEKDTGEMQVLADIANGLRISDKSMDRAYEQYFSAKREQALR